MKAKALTAAQIDTLAQRLSETPVKPATNAKKAGDTLARFLAARIGDERAALAFTSIMTVATAEQAEARLTLVLDYGNTEPSAGRPRRRSKSRRPRSPHRSASAKPSAIRRRPARCRLHRISPNRPTPGSAPNWPRLWP